MIDTTYLPHVRRYGSTGEAVDDRHDFLVEFHDVVLEDGADDGEDDCLQGGHDLLLILHHRQNRLDRVEDSHRRHSFVVRTFIRIDHLVKG